jgi:hypothetical protein
VVEAVPVDDDGLFGVVGCCDPVGADVGTAAVELDAGPAVEGDDDGDEGVVVEVLPGVAE